jgi:Flp pilus assembly protein TadD
MNQKGSQERALTELVQVAVDYVDILGPTSREATYRPTPGTAESMEPRYRMDLALTEVMRGAGPPAQPSARSAPTSRSPEILTASEALRRRDWDTARQVLRPLVDADSPGPARLLLARTELESGNLADAAAELDLLLSTRPKSARALALRARVHLEAGELDDARASAGLALQVASHSMVARRVMFDLEVAERLAQGHAERDSTGH